MSNNLKAIIEGLLFIYGDDGIALIDLQTVLENHKPSEIKLAVSELEEKYKSDDSSAFSIQRFGTNKLRLQTKEVLYEWFAKLEVAKEQSKLSKSSIEVLSIVAYKGPISKVGIDHIRGADSSYQVYKLKQRNLIRVTGKSEDLGRSNLYSITENFFKLFNLSGGKETLPLIGGEELQEIISENVEALKAAEADASTKAFFNEITDDDDFDELQGDE
ncbi:SMC-Scp complex subunit ScpB [Mesoplasma syrphidae]|uniref:SMC-Scp complex subunit ScpB n=1 Tax=Mesoplasma syrphidae TaxID=225999 RepID=A0A2K9BKB5_9MOLU|nr:SMC-Scp complex subunit ScpB [Mesoplasma syrphidae]AUF83676.1 SMC-Scp complex subunit ScpB [Mesoplasma syrphidae]